MIGSDPTIRFLFQQNIKITIVIVLFAVVSKYLINCEAIEFEWNQPIIPLVFYQSNSQDPFEITSIEGIPVKDEEGIVSELTDFPIEGIVFDELIGHDEVHINDPIVEEDDESSDEDQRQRKIKKGASAGKYNRLRPQEALLWNGGWGGWGPKCAKYGEPCILDEDCCHGPCSYLGWSYFTKRLCLKTPRPMFIHIKKKSKKKDNSHKKKQKKANKAWKKYIKKKIKQIPNDIPKGWKNNKEHHSIGWGWNGPWQNW